MLPVDDRLCDGDRASCEADDIFVRLQQHGHVFLPARQSECPSSYLLLRICGRASSHTILQYAQIQDRGNLQEVSNKHDYTKNSSWEISFMLNIIGNQLPNIAVNADNVDIFGCTFFV